MKRLALAVILGSVTLMAAGCDAGYDGPPFALAAVEVAPQPAVGWEELSAAFEYPVMERRAGVGGNVRIAITVGRDGRARDYSYVSNPSGGLGRAVWESLEAAAWEPGRAGGRAVPVRGDVCALLWVVGEFPYEGRAAFAWCGS